MALNVRGSDSLWWKTGIDLGGLKKGTKEAKGILASFARKISAMDIFAAISAGAALHIRKAIKETTKLAARYETLGVVMLTVGNNAGYASEEMRGFQKDLEKTGITMIQARQNLIRMNQAQMDLTKSSELARVAQDAAVIGNINSSDAFERLIFGIQSANIRVLRHIGINVRFQDAYQKTADVLGVAKDSFTEAERAEIRLNVVLEAGTRIAGSYEAAMDTAAKKALSLERHVENLKLKLGQTFVPLYGEIIDQITVSMKGLNEELTLNETTIESWGETLQLVFIDIEIKVIELLMRFAKLHGGIALMTEAVIPDKSTFEAFKENLKFRTGVLKAQWQEFKSLLKLDFKKAELPPFPSAKKSDITGHRPDNLASSKAAEDLNTLTEIRNNLELKKLEILKAQTPEAKALVKIEEDAREKLILDKQKEIKAEETLLAIEKERFQYQKDFNAELQAGLDEWVIKSQELFAEEREANESFSAKQRIKIMEELEEDRKKLRERKKGEEKKLLDTLLKDYRNFNKEKLSDYRKTIEASLLLTSLNDETEKLLREELRDIDKEIFDDRIQSIKEIGNALQSLGSIINNFDSNLGALISDVGGLSTDITQIMTATTVWGEVGSALSIASSLDKWAKKLSEYLVKVQETTKGKDEFSLYWEGWDEFTKAQREFQISITKGMEKIRWMEKLITYMETRRGDIWEESTGLERIQISRDIRQQINRLNEYITSTTPESIADSIVEGFRQGFESAADFADTFENLMSKSIVDAFTRTITTQMIADWYDQFALLSEGGLTVEEIEALRFDFKLLAEGARRKWADITKIMEQAGLSFPGEDITKKTGISGAIAGITERTAGLLEGQFNAMRINTVKILNQLTSSKDGKLEWILNAAREVRDNTYINKEIWKQLILTKDNVLVPSLNASREIRDNTYVNTEIWKQLILTKDNVLVPSLNAFKEIRDQSYYLDDIFSITGSSLNALREIRDQSYFLGDIFKKTDSMNDSLSVIMSTALDNLNANVRTADNTKDAIIHLRSIDGKLSAPTSAMLRGMGG